MNHERYLTIIGIIFFGAIIMSSAIQYTVHSDSEAMSLLEARTEIITEKTGCKIINVERIVNKNTTDYAKEPLIVLFELKYTVDSQLRQDKNRITFYKGETDEQIKQRVSASCQEMWQNKKPETITVKIDYLTLVGQFFNLKTLKWN